MKSHARKIVVSVAATIDINSCPFGLMSKSTVMPGIDAAAVSPKRALFICSLGAARPGFIEMSFICLTFVRLISIGEYGNALNS